MVIRRPARQGNGANSPGKAIHADFSEIRIAGGEGFENKAGPLERAVHAGQNRRRRCPRIGKVKVNVCAKVATGLPKASDRETAIFQDVENAILIRLKT
jgi:hypothetical protein